MSDNPRNPATGPPAAWRIAGRTLLVLLVLLGVEQLYRGLRRASEPTGRAEWIWAPDELPREAHPELFLAARDFELLVVPARARLLVLADEEYLAYLNGHLLGGNRCLPGAKLDSYPVEHLLLPGANRLALELRSHRGGGGAIANLTAMDAAGHDEEILVTNSSWRIVASPRLGHLLGYLPLSPSRTARSWGRPPLGRWGGLEVGEPRPTTPVLGAHGHILEAVDARFEADQGALLLDWGETASGYLGLELGPGLPPRVGSLRLALELPPDWQAVPASSITVGGQAGWWWSPVPERFRYARIESLAGFVRAVVRPVAADQVVPLGGGASRTPAGVFGIEPPSSNLP